MGPDIGQSAPLCSVEDALRLGVDGRGLPMPGPGHRNEVQHMEMGWQPGLRMRSVGMVLVAEMKPGGFDSGPEFHTLDNHMLATRFGSEYGGEPDQDAGIATDSAVWTALHADRGARRQQDQRGARITMVMARSGRRRRVVRWAATSGAQTIRPR